MGEGVSLRIAAAIGFAAVFAVITAAVVVPGSRLRLAEERWMAAIARRRTRTVDGIVGPLSMLATMEPLILQSLVAFAMLAVTLGRPATVQFVVASVGCGLLTEGVKRAVRRARPAGPHLIVWIRGFAYPSGDLLTAATIYATTALLASPHLPDAAARIVLFAIVGAILALLAACRVYAGVHHPSDVVGGASLGLAWALVVATWFA